MWRFIFFAILLLSLRVHADMAQRSAFNPGFVKLRSGQELWVERRPAQNGKATLFLLNGLTYTTRDWHDFIQALNQIDPELGIVLYDMEGQGKTLLQGTHALVDIPFDQQRENLNELYTRLAIPGDKYLIGLSYGGGVAINYLAKYPDDFKEVIALAPFVAQLDEPNQMFNFLFKNFRRMVFPLNTDEQVHDMIMHQFIYLTGINEPQMLDNPFKIEGIYRMIRGARSWNADHVAAQLPARKLHLVASLLDRTVPIQLLRHFWKALPERARASYIEIDGGSHKIPESLPNFASGWVSRILTGYEALKSGLTFQGNITAFEARSENLTVPLLKSCAEALKSARSDVTSDKK